MVRCVLYPGVHLFVTAGGKEQGSQILSSKVQEICKLIPAFSREIDWHRGQSKEGKDTVRYRFKNGSELDNLAARESTRGQRRHGGLMEECVGIDDKILREVIIPVMAVSRRAADGTVREDEPVNKSSIYIRISIITKKLVKANFLNCWEISQRQSATKLEKSRRLNDYPLLEQSQRLKVKNPQRVKSRVKIQSTPRSDVRYLGTTAGYKSTYSYDRLIGMLVRMVMQPDRCMVLGGTWRTPVAMGLQSKTFIQDQKDEGEVCALKNLSSYLLGSARKCRLTRKPCGGNLVASQFFLNQKLYRLSL